jgi:hypothetical protein
MALYKKIATVPITPGPTYLPQKDIRPYTIVSMKENSQFDFVFNLLVKNNKTQPNMKSVFTKMAYEGRSDEEILARITAQ